MQPQCSTVVEDRASGLEGKGRGGGLVWSFMVICGKKVMSCKKGQA